MFAIFSLIASYLQYNLTKLILKQMFLTYNSIYNILISSEKYVI